MRAIFYLAAAVIIAGAASAQKAALTAEEVMEKSIAAAGGREAMAKLSTSYSKAVMEFPGAEVPGSIERYAKAPNKQLTVTFIDGVGETRQGFDGHVAWTQDAAGKITELSGGALENMKRGASFNALLNWHDLYPKAEMAGKESVGGREAYVVKLTGASGKVTTRYFDAETYLLVREKGVYGTAQSPIEITADFSDYREVDGVKTPFQTRQIMPMGEIVFHMLEVKNNIPIEDAKFVRPEEK